LLSDRCNARFIHWGFKGILSSSLFFFYPTPFLSNLLFCPPPGATPLLTLSNNFTSRNVKKCSNIVRPPARGRQRTMKRAMVKHSTRTAWRRAEPPDKGRAKPRSEDWGTTTCRVKRLLHFYRNYSCLWYKLFKILI